MSIDFDQSTGRDRDFEISRLTREQISSRGTGIALIHDSTAFRAHLKRRFAHVVDVDAAAHGVDVHVAIANIGQANGPAKSSHMQMGITDIGRFNRSSYAFEDYIAT